MDAQHKKYRQVAIVVSALERDAADAVLAQLSETEADAVRRTILSMGEISFEEQQTSLTEFLRRGEQASPAQNNLDSGVELDESLARRMQAAAEADECPTALPPTFDCLQGVDGARLAALLKSEHAQTIAVVASHLSQSQAAAMVAELAPQQQIDVMRRLADLDEMDADSLREIESLLRDWLSGHLRDEQRKSAGLNAVAGILQAADPHTRQRLAQQLQQGDRQLAERLKQADFANATSTFEQKPRERYVAWEPAPTTAAIAEVSPSPTPVPAKVTSTITTPAPRATQFPLASSPLEAVRSLDELADLPERALRTLLRECEPELILLALAGAGERLVQRVLQMFPAREAETLRHALEHPGPTRLSDVDSAQQELLFLLQQLEQTGRIARRAGRLSMAA